MKHRQNMFAEWWITDTKWTYSHSFSLSIRQTLNRDRIATNKIINVLRMFLNCFVWYLILESWISINSLWIKKIPCIKFICEFLLKIVVVAFFLFVSWTTFCFYSCCIVIVNYIQWRLWLKFMRERILFQTAKIKS